MPAAVAGPPMPEGGSRSTPSPPTTVVTIPVFALTLRITLEISRSTTVPHVK